MKFLDGTKLFFDDQRKFGWMKMVRNDDWTKKLGPDALNELTVRQLENILKKSKRPIKLVLMDQSKIGGIGNIWGAVLGGFAIGFIENIGIFFIPTYPPRLICLTASFPSP